MEILTKRQTREFIKEEIKKQFKPIIKEIDNLTKRILIVEEYCKTSKLNKYIYFKQAKKDGDDLIIREDNGN